MTIEEIIEEEMEDILYIEEEKINNLKKVKNHEKDVTSANEDELSNEAHKNCAKDEWVTNDVTTVCVMENELKHTTNVLKMYG